MRNIIFSFIAVGGAVFCDFFVVDLSAAMTIALALPCLLAAATNGDVKEIRRLLRNGENPNQADEYDGITALMCAAENGHSEAAKVLLENKADPNQADKIGAMPLPGLPENEHLATFGLSHDSGGTALMRAATFGHSETVEVLLNNKATPNQATRNGLTALMLAAKNGHSKTAKILLENKADPKQTDKMGWTALIFAATRGHSETVKVFLENGAAPTDENGWTTLITFARTGKNPEVDSILKKAAEQS